MVVSDVVSDLTRFPPHASMVGDRHLTGVDSHARRSSRPSNADAASHDAPLSTPSTDRNPAADHIPTAPVDIPGRRPESRLVRDEDASADDPGERDQNVDNGGGRTEIGEDMGERRQEPAEGGKPSRARAPAAGYHSSPPSPQLRPTMPSSVSLNTTGAESPTKIVVRDLSHIQSFASEEMLTRSRHGSRRSLRGRLEGAQQYEISSMPVADIIEMVAGLLTKITTTNDRPHQHAELHRHLPSGEGIGHASATQQQTQSVLSFHGRNIPSITILSYLSRIHRYCPTTYEVFLSLLVYFDRMTEKVNTETLKSFRSVEEAFADTGTGSGTGPEPPASGSVLPQELGDASLVDSDDEPAAPSEENPGHVFVVDSFNIHRLVIAGVTCASKFFSDVFYTNSRYAKVCLHLLLPLRLASPP